MSSPFLGEIRMFAGNFAIRGWAFCNGQILSISQNTALFSLLGTNFGGNGTSNFGLPNLQGSAPVGAGNGAGLTPRVVGEVGGEESVTLIQSEMAIHNHAANCDSATGSLGAPGNNVWAASGGRGRPSVYATATDGTQLNSAALSAAGGNEPHNNLSPYLVVTFLIALQGIFPARN